MMSARPGCPPSRARTQLWHINWKYCFVSTASCRRKAFSKQVQWNYREGLVWQVKLWVSTRWFRKLAMGEWARSGWRNEATEGLNGA